MLLKSKNFPNETKIINSYKILGRSFIQPTADERVIVQKLIQKNLNDNTYVLSHCDSSVDVQLPKINRLLFMCGFRVVVTRKILNNSFNHPTYRYVISNLKSTDNVFGVANYSPTFSKVVLAVLKLEEYMNNTIRIKKFCNPDYIQLIYTNQKVKPIRYSNQNKNNNKEEKLNKIKNSLNKMNEPIKQQNKLNSDIYNVISNYENIVTELNNMELLTPEVCNAVNEQFNKTKNTLNMDIVGSILRKVT